MGTLDDRSDRALRPPGSLTRALGAAVAGFLDEYLGRPGAAVPFAGRDDELGQLDAWLARPDQPVALVVSEAGRGKSALLARWAAAQAERARASAEAPRVVFVPISLRFATALRGQAWKILAHGLAAALGRALPEAQDAAALRAECTAALASATGDAPRMVVILDGLDEAGDWACPDLDLCAPAGSAVKLVFSARTTPGADAAAWRARLGVADARCATLALDALAGDAVGALLAAIGGTELRDAPALAAELVRLSEGDPLLVRLYLDALISGSAQLAWMTPADLPRTPPGLDGWFACWWAQVGRTWRGDDALTATAGAVFDVLATALAPLPRADVEALVARIARAAPEAVAAALRAVRPLLAGDRDRGPFVLGHPRLRYFRLDAMREADRARLRDHFADHGEAQLRELIAGTRAPAQLSPYVLQHLSVHLAHDGGDPRRLWQLICAPWQRAWEAFDGTFDGFLGDVRRACAEAERAAGSADDALRAAAIEAIARAGLVVASVASLTYRLPPNLVGHLIDLGIWSPAVAMLRMVRPGGGFASEALRSLAPHLDLPLARAALDICAQHAEFVGGDLPGAEGLAALIVRLAALAGEAEVPAALERFPPAVRASVAAVAWRALPRAVWPVLAAAIRDGAAQVSHCSHAASVAFAALPMLDDRALRDAVIQQAMQRLRDEDFTLDHEHEGMLAAAGEWSHGWKAAEADRPGYSQAQTLAFIAPFVPRRLRAIAFAMWLHAYQQAAAHHSTIGLHVPADLPPGARDELLSWVRSHRVPGERAQPLIELAYQAPALRGEAVQVPALRAEAVQAVRALSGAHGVLARMAILPVLDPADRRALAIESYDLGLAELDAHRGDDLARSARYWHCGPDDRGWSYVWRQREPAALIVDALAWMPPDDRAPRVRALFARFRRIDDRGRAVLAVLAAIDHLPGATHPAWLARLVDGLAPGEHDAHALAALARLADRHGDPRTAELAAAAWRGQIRAADRPAAEALSVAAAHLPAATREDVQRDALTRWRDSAGTVNWSDVLRGLCDGLVPAAAVHAITQRDYFDDHSIAAVLLALPTEVRSHQATESFARLSTSLHWWHHDDLLATLMPHTPGAGDLLCKALDRPRLWNRPGPAEVAWMAAPLCRDGHVERARALRAAITDDAVGAWIADLALAIFGLVTGPGDPIARTLDQLPDVMARAPTGTAHGDLAMDAALARALDWLAPIGRTEQLLAVAAALPAPHGLRVALQLQARGLEDAVRDQITPARIRELDRGDFLLRSGLAAAHWSPHLSPIRAGELWAAAWQPATHYDRQARLAPRRDDALQIVVDRLPLAVRAGDATTPARLAELALEIGDWFP